VGLSLNLSYLSRFVHHVVKSNFVISMSACGGYDILLGDDYKLLLVFQFAFVEHE
jgi:hypothetical protein